MLASDFRDDLTYTLNEELHVLPDRVPTGIQAQAFDFALQQLTLSYAQLRRKMVALRMIEGFAPAWQVRIQSYQSFLDRAFEQLSARAKKLSSGQKVVNSPAQGEASATWNEWSYAALQNAVEAAQAFTRQVQLASQSAPLPALVPQVFVALGKSSGITPPSVMKTDLKGLGDMGELTTSETVLLIAGAGFLLSFGLDWLSKRRGDLHGDY